MAILNIHRVNELPTALEAHALYVLRKQEFGRAELIFTSAEGVAYPILDTASVQNIVGNAINGTSSITIMQTIAERDEYVFAGDSAVYVVDATGDPEVLTGSALYFYKKETNTFVLIICAKHTSWSDALGKPVSTPDQIDEAVEKMHIHENNEVLSNLTEGEDGTTLSVAGVYTNDSLKLSPGESIVVKSIVAGVTVRVQGSELTKIK